MKYLLLIITVLAIVGGIAFYNFSPYWGMNGEAKSISSIFFGDTTHTNLSLSEESREEVEVAEQMDRSNENAEELKNKEDENNMTNNNKVSTELSSKTETALIAGGCFWCVEADIEKLPGVIEAVSGYSGGSTDNPTYGNYSSGGHREVVQVTYDPDMVSFEEIIIFALKHMDPTDGDGSFYDRGKQYAPAFYYTSTEEKKVIENLIKEIDDKGPYDKPLAIDVEPVGTFWPAEDYHQDYYKGALSSLKYKYYRNASGRDDFIEKYWGTDTSADLSWRNAGADNTDWSNFTKPSDEELKQVLTDIQYKVTQKEATEPAFNNTYWDNHEEGIYVDVVSGEPLFSSTHKFDSGTGWPSFTRPINYDFVTEHKDYKLIIPRTEIRSAIADSHLGHVFNDAPQELGGIRYCMNSAALRFVARSNMEKEGYGDFLYLFN